MSPSLNEDYFFDPMFPRFYLTGLMECDMVGIIGGEVCRAGIVKSWNRYMKYE